MFSAMRSSRKMLVTCAVAVAALAGPVAGANADASLTLTPSATSFSGQANTVTAAGTAAGAGYLAVYAEAGAADCEATANDEVTVRDFVLVGTGHDPVAGGAFSLSLSWSPIYAMDHMICGYLYAGGQTTSDAPQVKTSTPVTVVVKPANTDPDGDGVPTDVDRCPDVAGAGADGCPPPVTPVKPVTPSGPVAPASPLVNAPAIPAGPFDPSGVLKLKSSKGKTTSCGAGCLIRTRTVGPFSFTIKVKVSGAKTTGAASVTLTRKGAQAGRGGRVCLGRFTAKTGQICKAVKAWAVGKKITVAGSITTPSTVGKSGRPGFGVTAYVGQVFVGNGTSVYLKSKGGRVQPDTNESACTASAGAHAAC